MGGDGGHTIIKGILKCAGAATLRTPGGSLQIGLGAADGAGRGPGR